MTQKAGLKSPVQYLKGIGPKRAAYLDRLGIRTVEDLLFVVPRRYWDRATVVAIKDLAQSQEATVLGTVQSAGVVPTRTKGNLVSVRVSDETGTVNAVWFNRPDLRHVFKKGQEIVLSGPVSFYRGKQLVNPYYEMLDPTQEVKYTGAVVPIYPLTEGLSLWEIRRAVEQAVNSYAWQLEETLPRHLLDKYNFPDLRTTLRNLHLPDTVANGQRAKERLIYEELFYFELLLALRKKQNQEQLKGFSLQENGSRTQKFVSLLPFQFTRAQARVLDEIKKDMANERCMNRLLQGDVGSGKTVIALYAMLVAVENGFQAALMAPTEILAEQHFLGWKQPLNEIGVSVELLTASVKPKEKKVIYDQIESGTVDIILGTHAVIEEDVRFNRLGLAVIDEQHRFGVMQRATFLNKGLHPDFLVMTATPIPRTLALTLYGDLDISTLDEKPPGRQKITTKLVIDADRVPVYQFLKEKLGAGQQAYWVCPIIEESETAGTDALVLKSAKAAFTHVCAIFPEFKVALLHGRLASSERIAVMRDFREGKIDILVSTTVIEVGVDVPKATVMIIEHPERFGLAQLHQLRGRVGRGAEISYCILMASDSLAETGERLQFFADNDDGFALAEKDMEIRGYGDLLGTRQHGLPDLKIADLHADVSWLGKARDDAFAVAADWAAPENSIIRRTMARKFKDRADLIRVG